MNDYVRYFLVIAAILFILGGFYSLFAFFRPVENPTFNILTNSIASTFISFCIAAGIIVYLRHIK